MITFVSLFLGLVLGAQPVQLDVSGDIATVVLELDGQQVARLAGPPWSTTCDFGRPLQPHRLVATGYDAHGAVVATEAKWINLPRGATEVHATLLPGPEPGRRERLRLHWQNVFGDPPSDVRATFDRVLLFSNDPHEFVLPDYDPASLHILSVEVEFPHNLSAVEELTVGGGQLERTSRELTGIPVLARFAGSDLEPQKVDGRLETEGRPVRVTAVEEGPAQVIVVVDPRAREDLENLIERGIHRVRERRIRLGYQEPTGRGGAYLSLLQPGDWVRFVWPFAAGSPDDVTRFDVFDFSREYTRDEASFVGLLRFLQPPRRDTVERERLSDAVAVAGLLASTRSRRRAVIVVVGGTEDDASYLPPPLVRDYLMSLRVPLFVWATSPEAARAAAERWGDVDQVRSIYSLEDAIERVGDHLARQRIVWVEGAFLPQNVEAAPGSHLDVVR